MKIELPEKDPLAEERCGHNMCEAYLELYDLIRSFAIEKELDPGQMVALLLAMTAAVGDLAQLPRVTLATSIMEAPGEGQAKLIAVGSTEDGVLKKVLDILNDAMPETPPRERN